MGDFFGVSPADDTLYHHMRAWRDAAAYVERLWELSEPYLDEGRPEAAARALQPVVWEMYLAASFVDQGHDVKPREGKRKRNGGPDIQIGDVTAWIEAVIATAGVGRDAVPPLDTDPNSPMRKVPDRELMLRITNAIDEKWRKYRKYREAGLVREDEPFVIAINGAELPTGFVESSPPRIARAVFGIGSLVVSFDRETLKAVDEHYAPMPDVEKMSGCTVPTKHFRDDQYKGISAVIWGMASPWRRPDFFGRDLMVVHNPFAANPLPRGWFREGVEFWAENDVRELHWKEHWRERPAETAAGNG
ncbi:MAG TPA: hypothetical protein VGJ81_05275 [Thermoanaerobaculia bacterium]